MLLQDLPLDVFLCIIDTLAQICSDRQLMRHRLVSKTFAKTLLRQACLKSDFQNMLIRRYCIANKYGEVQPYTENLMATMLHYNIQRQTSCKYETFTRLRNLVDHLLSIECEPRVDVDDDRVTERSRYFMDTACQWAAKLRPEGFINMYYNTAHTRRDMLVWAYGLAAFMGDQSLLDKIEQKLHDRSFWFRWTPKRCGCIIGAAAYAGDPQVLRRVTETVMALSRPSASPRSVSFSPGVAVAAAVAVNCEPGIRYLFQKINELSISLDTNNADQIIDAFARANKVSRVRALVRHWRLEKTVLCTTITRACVAGSVATVKELLWMPLSEPAYDYFFDAAMQAAIKSFQPGVVRTLIQARDNNPGKPFIRSSGRFGAPKYAELACLIGAYHIFQIFADLKLSARQIDPDDYYKDYLGLAVDSGNLHLVKYILSTFYSKFDVHHRVARNCLDDSDKRQLPDVSVGVRALGKACFEGELSIARALIDSGVPVNEWVFLERLPYNYGFIEFAMLKGHESIIRLLLERKCPITLSWNGAHGIFIESDEKASEEAEGRKPLTFPLLPSPEHVSVHGFENTYALRIADSKAAVIFDLREKSKWRIVDQRSL